MASKIQKFPTVGFHNNNFRKLVNLSKKLQKRTKKAEDLLKRENLPLGLKKVIDKRSSKMKPGCSETVIESPAKSMVLRLSVPMATGYWVLISKKEILPVKGRSHCPVRQMASCVRRSYSASVLLIRNSQARAYERGSRPPLAQS